MKVIAMYLPQFHRTKENDEWWGKGFTEWTTVKSAKPLFEGHAQPRIPLNNNYYNLLEEKVFAWQATLMKEYCVDGLCFYHYYFKDGRKVLETPAENLLRWKEINLPFCFSWANETWSRTWSKMNGTNIWSSKFETRKGNDNNGVLLEQAYGSEEQWIEHFEYLLPFFSDNRYIKKDGKPLFVIYKPDLIPCLTEMIECWKRLAVGNGFEGIYVIGTNTEVVGPMDAILLQEPQYSLRYMEKSNRYDGNEVWEKSLCQVGMEGQRTYYCGFPGYDDTPRRGSAGIVLNNIGPSEFKKHMEKLISKSREFKNEFCFVNAWNEWGEGMYLEPDTLYQYKYLEALRDAIKDQGLVNWRKTLYSNEDDKRIISRYKSYWTLYDKWLTKIESNHNIYDYFSIRKYKTIAVYGMGMIGRHFVYQINEKRVKFGIDKNCVDVTYEFPIYKPDDDFPEVDVIVVTVSSEYSTVYNLLRGKVKCPIVSIDEVIDGC